MLDQGIALLKENEKPIIHSERGCHYRWPGWIKRIEKAGLIRSMSKKGCSPDNAACEGFFGILKNEMFYDRDREVTTALFLLRCVQIGLSMNDLDELTIGMIMDMAVENKNDDYDYPDKAEQEDFNRF